MVKRRPLIFAVLAIALAGGAWRWWTTRAAKQASEVKYTTTQVERGKLVAKVTASGTLSALVTVQVGAQVSGRIQQILVDFNSPVKKGQVIARIDPQLLGATVEQARANYNAGQSNAQKSRIELEQAKRNLVRSKALAEKNLIAQADLDVAQTNADSAVAAVAAAEASVGQLKASLHQAQLNLEYTTISSPIDGVVISRSVDVGQTVASALQAPTLFTIAEDLRKMQVDTSVAEADVGKLRAGMDAYFSVDAYPTERFKGTVRQIRNAPTTVQNVVTYDAVIDVANADLKLKPGMTANVTFPFAEREDILKVSNAALRFRPPAELTPVVDGGAAPAKRPPKDPAALVQRTVWILEGGKLVARAVKTGISDGTVTEITEGDVKEGELAVTDASAPGKSSTTTAPFPRRGI